MGLLAAAAQLRFDQGLGSLRKLCNPPVQVTHYFLAFFSDV